jgi:hypothetical protein
MIIIYGNDYHSPILNFNENVSVISIAQLAEQPEILDKQTIICTTHEEAVELIVKLKPTSSFSYHVNLFRNKYKLRQALQGNDPNFFFQKIQLSELKQIKLNFNVVQKYIIKPVKGFFNIGVYSITADTNLAVLQSKIEIAIAEQQILHPEYFESNSLSATDFLIEQFVGSATSEVDNYTNAEIAIDGFYDSQKNFHITSIYFHPYKNQPNYFHFLYYMTVELYQKFQPIIVDFFENLKANLSLNIKNFSLHAEFKYCDEKLLLIEINPGRFAGLGLSDLLYYSFHTNPYELFYKEQSFNWQQHQTNLNYFSWILAYRDVSDKNHQRQFNQLKFNAFLGGDILHNEQISYDPSVFSINFVRNKNAKHLQTILNCDLKSFLED